MKRGYSDANIKGLGAILEHGRKFIEQRLAPARPNNDGRQTPMRGHPVFVAQHATATCCRSCLAKWHGIEPGAGLSDEQIEYVLRVIRRWITQGLTSKQPPTQPLSGGPDGGG